MMLLREAAGISDSSDSAGTTRFLMRETLRPGSAAAKTTLLW